MEVAELVKNGLPLKEITLIDMHCHIGNYNNLYLPYPDEEEQLVHYRRTMERAGAVYSVVSMLRGLASGDLSANLDLAAHMREDPKLLGWVTYIPYLPELSIDTADRCFSLTKQFIGFKVHPEINRYPIEGPDYIPMWEYANDRGLLVLSHAWGPHSEPSMFRELAARYPNAKILLGHCGGREPEISAAIDLANRFDNVYLDLNGAFIYSRVRMEDFARTANPDKLLFSSDTMFNNIFWELGNVVFAPISEEMKRNILGLNAKRLLKDLLT